MTIPPDALQAHLETMLGPAATFREGQREAIEAVVRDGSRTLVVQRTGLGQEPVYFVATRLLRDQGHGPTLIVARSSASCATRSTRRTAWACGP